MKLINGNEIAQEIYSEIRKKIQTNNRAPKLGIILINDDEPSIRYVGIKRRECSNLGIDVEVFQPTLGITDLKDSVIEKINQWNNDDLVDGIMIQLPITQSLKSFKDQILNSISPEKDVDGLTKYNLEKLKNGENYSFISATPLGVIKILKNLSSEKGVAFKEFISNKRIAIINDSNLVGKPLFYFLSRFSKNCEMLNKRSEDIKGKTIISDIVITATGVGQIFDESFFKEGSILIDVTSKKIDGKVVGDIIVDQNLQDKVDYLTPVPGGVGPVTVASLIENLTYGPRSI